MINKGAMRFKDYMTEQVNVLPSDPQSGDWYAKVVITSDSPEDIKEFERDARRSGAQTVNRDTLSFREPGMTQFNVVISGAEFPLFINYMERLVDRGEAWDSNDRSGALAWLARGDTSGWHVIEWPWSQLRRRGLTRS